MDAPKTLIEAVRYFSDPDRCDQLMRKMRWPTGTIRCPECDSTIKLVTFGLGGDTAYCGSDGSGKSTISGYGRPDRPHAGESNERHPIADGTPALNLIPAVRTDAGWAWAFRGPMVDVDLPDGEVDRCPDPDPMFAAAVSGNQFGTLLAVHAGSKTTQKAGALDSVSRAEYISGWLALGAKLGHYENGKIVWDEPLKIDW